MKIKKKGIKRSRKPENYLKKSKQMSKTKTRLTVTNNKKLRLVRIRSPNHGVYAEQ